MIVHGVPGPFEDEDLGLVGPSPALARARTLIRRFGPRPMPVVVTGPTGTGKELAAHAVHRVSGRRGRWLAINVAALPEHLVESELFGVARGAFTGAAADRSGLIETATGGTLYLDEAADLPLAVQAKLLRALDTRSVRRVGDVDDRRADTRFVISTQCAPGALVSDGRWRQDFYYRVAGAMIELPPLALRHEDLIVLAQRFAAEYQLGPLDDAAIAVLAAHRWPGNVRELRRVVEMAAVEGGGVGAAEIAASIAAVTHTGSTDPDPGGDRRAPDTLAPLREIQRRHIELVLDAVGNNTEAAARVLELSEGQLYRRFQQLGITPPRFRTT